ncbi:transcriptional regulator, MarR family protein [Mesotoga sp. SC_NapDC3]|uniref:MarR family winged helix-turn-helix transcriptional regulator n=1 Tax=Mesotoga sp. TaxID=2053577 RepID=UPI000CC1D5AE|nr:MarR family transcriptional regulator [Mesotoga sp.]PNQ05678.1 transcriptional regulator, MarR family protein [Mesotoga sp. SC_NapDC3]PXF34812.1 transcriptional regulator, MarR family protein [Mesotoga sp. SC_NapDC]HAY98602.1 MarR family transcriptional regulator [Mesotoga sp.]
MEESSRIEEMLTAIKRIVSLIKQNFERDFKKMHVTQSQILVMRVLNQYGDMKISDISRELDLSNSTVSGIIDRLVEKKIVKRKRSEEDRRIVMISLAEEYRQPVKKQLNAFANKMRRALSTTTEEDLDSIMQGLEKLERILEESQEYKERGRS